MPDSPPAKFETERKDRATRLLIEGQDQLAVQVCNLKVQIQESDAARTKELEHYVSYKALFAFIGVLLAFAYWYFGQVKEERVAMERGNERAKEQQTNQLKQLTDEMGGIRRLVDGSASLKASEEKKRKR